MNYEEYEEEQYLERREEHIYLKQCEMEYKEERYWDYYWSIHGWIDRLYSEIIKKYKK